jgi:hypothetical protein
MQYPPLPEDTPGGEVEYENGEDTLIIHSQSFREHLEAAARARMFQFSQRASSEDAARDTSDSDTEG